MEIRINKEIRGYQESIFFGLSMRQFFCTLLALGTAVLVYFLFNKALGRETVSWICLVAAAPVAAAGFFRYNGLTLEKFLWAFFKSQVLFAAPRAFHTENLYREILKGKGEKEHD